MPAATIIGGSLVPIEDCYIAIPCEGCDNGLSGAGAEFASSGEFILKFKVLPDISDSKTASYNDEQVIGRASPLKTYAQSDNRTLSVQIHMVVSEAGDIEYNLAAMRAIQSAAYPRNDTSSGAPFVPPPVCRIKCGKLLSQGQELCVVLKSYSVKFPTEIAWDEQTLLPYKFDIDTSWDVVYKSADLPGQDRIFISGR
jgi:hypothetical protein